MAVTKLGQLKESLLEGGRDGTTAVVLVHNASHVDQQVVKTTIELLDQVEIPTPALILVGNPAAIANPKPRLLFTGIDSSRLNFREELVHFPLIRTSQRIINDLDISLFDGVIFTSLTAVDAFFKSYRPLATQKMFAVGPHAAEAIESKGVEVHVIPEIYDADHLAPLVIDSECSKILYPCSQLSENVLHEIDSVNPVIFK